MIKLSNTLTGKLDEFKPLRDGEVSIYTCGPTVYDYPTVGNWVSYVYWDILVRMFIDQGYAVNRVMNITDVGHLVSDADDGEDKLEKGAKRDGKTAWEVAEYYTEDFLLGMKKLNLTPPNQLVRATDFIDQQLSLVRTLKSKGYTYQIADGIYFDTSKFPSYADFAHLDLSAQIAGARVEENIDKRQPWDFAIWKFTPSGEVRDMEWPTPSDLLDSPSEKVKMGFPGWHLECSAIAMSSLGDTIDIHTGGIDHIPVHHTNEIAQSESASGQPFAHYWIHNNHLKIDGGKVSKSLGNGYTLQDIEAKGFSALDLKMFILQGHYSNEGNFTFENLKSAQNRLNNWKRYAVLRHQTHPTSTTNSSNDHLPSLTAVSAFQQCLADDLNTARALQIIDQAFSTLDNLALNQIDRQNLIALLDAIDSSFGLSLIDSTPDIDEEVKQIILERQRFREDKNWAESDRLRSQLEDVGITILDRDRESIWQYLV